MAKTAREKFKTYGNVFDNFTTNTIAKLISQGHIDGIESPVSIGKEANIFTARKGKDYVILKIYRLEACDFNRMYDYLKYDIRYSSIKRGKRNVVFTWTQREYRNLHLAREGKVNVPLPFTRLNNVLVLELIGDKEFGKPASQVKRVLPADPEDFLKQTISAMKNIHKSGLVHGDLSEYNILNLDETPVIIDMSQSTSIKSPNASELLDRDIKNMVRFFGRLGAKITEKAIKKKILGNKKNNKE